MKTSKINRLVIALTGVLVLSIGSAYAGSAYSDGRAYLRQGSPSGAGKVYVSTSSSTPAASSYKACNTIQTSETTTPSASAQVKGEKTKTTYHFWAVANAGYIFTGWYDSNGNLLGSGAAHVSGSVTSGQAGGSDTHAYLDYHASFIKQIQMSFITPTNGSYTITHCGTEVTPAYSSFATEGKVVLTAMPADGYKLRGWYTTTNGGTTKKYFAFGTTCEPNFTSNVTIGADFVADDGKATFWNKNNGKIYNDLNTANSEASSGHVIVAVSDGVLGAGTYTIKAGVTLLIPFDETYNLMTTPKVNHMASGTTSLFLFRKLTLAPGAVINCSGNICVGGQMASVNGGRASSYPMGACGMLDLSRGGTINLKNGSILYAWGFVKGQDMEQGNNTEASGVGKIVAESGATVWEDFQVGEWRGGTASSTIYSNKGSWKFFPFQSYTIQNVEAPVEYQTGSKLKCYWAIFGNGQTFTVPFTAVGASTDSPLFVLGSGGTMKKWYDPTTDRVCYELGGGASIDAISLSVMGESVSSSDYYLPIPANMHIALSSGCTLNLTKAMTMHAGSVVEVKSGATLNINARVHMFDQEDWGTYCMYAYYYRTYRNLTSHYNRGEGTSKATLEDATLIVDGTVNVGNQMLYATAHGANICGNGGGTLKYGTLPGNTTMTQCTNLSDANSVNIRSANLHNENGSYTKGTASKLFYNVNGRWFVTGKQNEKANHTYDFTYIKTGDVYGTGGTNATTPACYSKDKTGLVLQDKWANVKAQGCTNWWLGVDDGHLYNWSRNSAWHQYILTGSVTTGEGEEAVTTETYVGSDGKMLYKTDCEFVEAGSIDGNCLYPSDKALVNGSLITVAPNASPDHGYHKSDAATTYYLCFEGCVWHPATRNAENRYTVDGKVYIWYGDKWLGVEYDSSVSLYYSLSATNVKIYYEYVNHEWVLATPVAEVTTSAGTEQVFSLANAITKAKAGGTNVTIRLLKSMSGTISYDGANNCTLDLNGFTLSSSTYNMITVNNASATFIIKDQSAAGTGKVKYSCSENNARRYAVYVQNGHVMLNSGTIEAVNTLAYNSSTAPKPIVCGVQVAAGKRFTMNGGLLKVSAAYNPYGVYGDGAATTITINGGTIDCEATTIDSPYGIISYGVTNMNGGTVKATATKTTSAIGIYVHASTGKQGHLYMTGGTVQAESTTSSTATGILVNRGVSYNSTTAEPRTMKSEFPAMADISGGTIKAITKTKTATGITSHGKTRISGGTIEVTATTNTAMGVYVYGDTTTISGPAHIDVKAANTAYGVRLGDIDPHKYGGLLYNGTLVVNGGIIDVTTTSAGPIYGVYVGAKSRNVTTTHATDVNYFAGSYANAGTAIINNGEINVTSKTTDASALYVGAVLSGTFTGNKTPKCTVNGGKFMSKNSNGDADGVINNTAAAAANFSLAGGYYNVAPAGSYVAAGKSVKDVDCTKEAAMCSAGYVKKIAGNEYTVTWKDHAGNVIGTSQVESGKVPVWTGGEVNVSDANSTREHNGWCTAAWNGGTSYVFPTALPAIVDADVTYFAHYNSIYADVTTGGVTTRYNSAQGAWTAAMAAKQATIRLLSNLGTEASIGNMTQMVFNPTNANSVIIMDLNGHSWTMGRHATAANNTTPFIHVNPTQTGCKLIITDNSASGNGYLMNSWEKTDGALTCIQVSKGELVLQKGALKVKNTASSQYSSGVYVGGASAHFTMTGGTVYSTDGYSPRGVCVGDGYADIAGGTVEANSTASEAYALLSYDTVTVSGGATLRATGATGSSYAAYCNGAAAVLNIDSAILISNAYQTARGIYSLGGGQTTVDGKSSISATTTTGSGAYALYATGANTKITANDGTYTATSALNSAYGVFAENNGAAIVNGGSFTVTATGTNARGIFAQSNGTVTVKGGSLDVTSDTHADPSSFGAYAAGGTVNIEDGNFTLNVHKDLSNRNCDLTRCGTGASYLNISGGTFVADSGYHAVRSFGGETMITGNPVFTAQRGVDAGSWASDDGTAKITIDGGTFYCTDNYALYATTHTYNGKTVVGDMTVLDGKFHTKSSIQPVYSSSGTSYLKIKGGYFTSYTSSNVSNLNNFVVAPSYTTAVESTDPMYASPNDYRYRVNTKYTVTWSVGGVTTTQQYNRNETPNYGSTPVYPGTDTYEFIGWSPELAPVNADVTYTAQFRKWEAEVYEGENPTPKRFEHFTDAFDAAKNLPVARIKVLSNVYYSTSLTLNPDSASGSKPLTIDLNNHVVNYTPATATYALTINKAGCKLIIDDSSVAKGGQFGHRQTANNGATISAIYIQNGELELAGGTIIAQNNNIDSSTDNSKGTRAVVGSTGTVFTMTGGKLYAKSRFDARAFNSDGNCTFNATGGTIEATTEYEDSGTKWGNNAYGVVLWNYGTFNMSGTASMSVTSATGALGVYPYGGGSGYPVANISGGSMTCLTKTGGGARPINLYGSHSKATISGGDITANGPAGQWNIECVYCDANATADITGGNFHSTDGGGYCTGVRVFAGTVNISGNPYFDSRHGVVVGDYATTTADATAYVNGGTFNCPQYVFYATSNTRDGVGTVTGKIYVNGGYFKTASGNNICYTGSGTSNLILHGGYYNETSGTTQKSNITTYKGATTEVSTLSPAITVDGRTYHYQLLTDFNITWTGGDSYSKVTTLKSGTMPTNTDLDGKCFLRNDSAFYFTGWSPTPSAVTGDATYTALGVYHEAKVTVAAQDSIFDNFDEAWSYAMDQANATITLLTNLTRTTSIVYNPTPANARHTFDLNNFTIKENTKDRLLVVNKSDAKLTITDNSSEKGGCLYKKMNSSANMYTTVIYHGELILAGGKLYVENTKDDKEWHPALAVHTSVSTDGIFTMTGGTVESQAKYLAYPIYNYATTNISGGTVIANATSGGSALGFYAVAGTATISGGTFNITASTNAIGAIATGWISADGSNSQQGTLNITGGTFNVSCTTSGAHAVQATGTGKNIGGTYYTSHGIMNVSGGTFNVTCPPIAAATQVFAAQVNAWRQFDDALPHTMVAEARGEMNISGGTFTVDARNNGAWVANSGNVDLLRNWGTLNVSGGNFTIHQYSTPSAISVFRGKATVTGNPVFNVYAHTGNAYAVCAGYWTHENYCDKNAANNLAEAEVNGGTFKIITEGQNTDVIYALGQISQESHLKSLVNPEVDSISPSTGTYIITAHAGYAMNAKVTVNGGEFLGICPNESGKYPIMLNSRTDQVGTYGTAKSEIYVNGGKFKSRKGTEADNTTSGAVNCHNNVGTLLLTGGYYETSGQLAAQKADTCVITNITSADIDPEYNNGYRYRIDVDYQAKVTVGGVERKFALFRDAFEYAKTQNNATITLLRDINYEGLNFVYNPSSAKSCTLDLNGFTFKGAVSGHTGDASYNNDRLLVINKAGATFTIKDSSVGQTGKWSHEKAGAGFSVIVYRGLFVLESGTVHGKNTSGGSVQALRSENYPEALISVTGGKAHAETAGTAYGMSTYNKATISGGEILAESSAGEAYGIYTNAAEDTTVISGGRIYAAGTNGYGVRSASITTISGGKIIGECINTTGVAYGVSVAASTTTITGVDSIYAHATKNAYGVYSAGTGVATINGGKIISRNGDSNGATITAYAINSGTININNGTFYIYRDVAGSSNIQTTRTGNNAIMNITGGTFHAEGYQAVNARGGTTNISGGTFYGTTGICAMDWADAATITANVNVTGGTFTTTGTTIYVSSNNANNGGRNGHSVVWINGGKFKSTGSTIVSMNATPSGADPSTLTIAGGYFNEKSGTTFKDQIATYVADTSEINTLDPLYEGIYKYEVAPHYVAKVQTGSTTKYHTTAKAAFDYAKTVANPTITLLDNCTLSPDGDATNYNRLNSNSWTGTLDLNNFTLTPTISSEGRAFTVTGTGSKFTITDNSVAKGGKIYYQGPSTGNIIYIVVEGSAEVELAAGTIYVEDTSADKVAVGFVVNSATAKFTQSGGTFTVKGKYQAQGYYGSGTATFSGGSMYVEGETSQAIGLHPNAATAVLNVSGTFELDSKSAGNAYAVYAENGTATIEGTPDFYAESPTRARVLQGTSSGNLTVDGGTFEANGTTASQSDCYVLIPEGSSTMTINGGKFKNNQNNFLYKGADASLTINGGYFNEYTTGTNHRTLIDGKKGSGKVVLNLDTDDAEYIAGYRYVVTDDPVAKVKVGSEVTYYTTLPAAFNYAKTQNNAEVTLLKDVVSTSTYTWSPSSAISNTFDLNGHSLSSTTGTVLGVGKAGATLTIKDTPGGGSISYSSTTGNWSPTVHVGNGKLVLQGGTISRTANSDNAIGVQVYTTADATPEFEMTGGKIQTSGGSSSYAVLTKSTGSNYAETTISGGEVSATATGTYAFALTAAQKGRITVKGTNNPRISASDATNATQVARNEGGGATFTIEGGLFKASHNSSPFNGAVSISGGYFNEYGSTTTYKTQIDTRCVSPKHPIELTAAEQAALGEGGTDYKYKVVDAYTLTWTTDGDALTGDYTSGMTAVGATIVQPNTPTKTGYTFAAWTPAVAATMPAANTTYTATWTVNSYTIRFLNYNGSVLQSGSVNYGETPVYAGSTPTRPTDATYTYEFTGWSPAIASVSGAQDYTAQFSQTANVASVTEGGETTYYTTLKDAFDYAADKTEPTIQVLSNITLAAAVTYNNTSTTTVTFDLNGYTVSSSKNALLTVSAPSNAGKFIIKDSRTDGKISCSRSSNSSQYCVYAYNGEVELQSGTIYMTNTNTGASVTAIGVYVRASRKFTMTGGTVQAVSKKSAQAIYSLGTTTISGGSIIATENANGIACGVLTSRGTTTIQGNPVFTVKATTQAYGVVANGTTPSASNTGYSGTIKVKGGTFNVETTNTTTAYGAYACAGAGYSQTASGATTPIGNYIKAGIIEISGGEFDVKTKTTDAYGIYVDNGTQTNADAGDPVTAYGKCTITENTCKFNVTSTSDANATAYAMNTTATDANLVVKGGYYSTKKTGASTNIEDKYTHSGKATSLYRVFDIVPALESKYNYKVAQFYTYAYHHGTNGAGDEYTDYKAKGDPITLPGAIYTRTGYTQTGWSTSDGGSKACDLNFVSNNDKNFNLYPFWTANTNTVTFDKEGGSGGDNSVTATYDAAMPTVTPPTKENYVFDGYWDGDNGTGVQYYNADGTSARTWDKTSNTTLYAKWLEAVASVQVGVGTPEYFATVADAIAAANSKSNPTVTMLQDAPTEEVTITAAMTIELNGKTISSTEATAEKAVFKINASGKTVTIQDSGSGGKIDHTASVSGKLYGVSLTAGTLSLQSGTIYAKNNGTGSDRAVGIYTDVNSTSVTIAGGTVQAVSDYMPAGIYSNNTCALTMTGGTVTASGVKTVRTIMVNGSATFTNATVTATASGSGATTGVGIYVYSGNVTINSGTYTATGVTAGYIVEQSSGSLTIAGGRFNATTKELNKTGGTGSITGGYYVHNTDLATYCAANYHVFDLAGQSPYLYEVAQGYTLTWTTDGDPLTGTYTTGMTKVGTTIVQPNTPTKTGYTFNAWSPAVAATMPAANTEYTATWTAKSCTVTFDKEGGEGGSDNTTATYNTAMTTITAPTKTGYTFGGYWDGDDGTGTQYYNADGTSARTWDKNTTAATTLYAKWTPNTYTITLNGNSGSGHTASVTATYNSATLSSAITNPTRAGYTFTGWYTATSGTTLVINVDGTLKANVTGYTGAGGIWTATENKTLYAHWLQNVVSVTVGGETRNYTNSAAQWTEAMTFAKTGNATVNVLQNCTVATRLTYDPASAYTCTFDLNGKKLTYTASGSPFITVNKAGAKLIIQNTGGAANGEIYQKYSATTADMKAIAITAGTLEVTGGTIHVENSGTSTNSYKTYAVEVATGGTLTMTDGILYADGGTKSAPSAACVNGGTATISGGKFKVSNGYILRYLSGTLTTTGGYYTANSVGLSSGNNTLDDYCSDPKHLVPTTAADKESVGNEYNWKVATAYRLSWSTDGDALTGDYTKGWYYGVYAGYGNVEPGATIVAPNTPTKTGYTFSAWSPAFTGTMPSANTTYTATWTANTYSVRFNKNDEGATGTMSNEAFTYDVEKALTANAFTKTGYNFDGWATSAGGDVVYTDGQSVSNLSSTQGAVVDLYAKWTAATYEVTLNQNGATTSGSTSVTMTYGSAEHSGITNPKKTGYSFKGWYTSAGGGTRIIKSDGTLGNKTGYVEDGVWVRTTATTLYAGWTQTIKLDKNGGSADGSAAVRYNSTANLTVTAPTREGYTAEGYYAEPACTNKVLTTAGAWVNYSGWVEGGKWVHDGESTLYTKWIEDTHTVTVAAGANGSASPASVTAGITTPSETITATPNTGYHFDNWTIPAGVTIASGSTTSASITINATADGLTITANFAVNSYDVTLNTNGGTVNAGNVTSYTYGVGATLPTDVTKAGYTFAGWFDNSELTGSAVTTISTTATGDKEYWAKWTPVALLRFTGATDNQWSKSSNWDPACVPTEAHDIYIQKPCSVDIEHAVAKSIVIDQSSSHTGKLNIGANKGLEVVGTISRTTTGEDNLSTRTEDLILETSTAGNATLIFDNSNSNAATVDLYSKGYIDGSGTKNYQYIGVPVTEANAQSNFYGSWMYSWGQKKSGAWGWVSVKNGASVYPWTGYCITQESPTYYDIHGILVPTTTKDIDVPADENMVVGNSWTAPIDINAMTTDDLEGLTASIYFFNTGVDKEGSAGVAGSRYAGGTYVTVPVEAAKYTGEDDHINSMQGFFVKSNGSAGTLHLDYDKHVRNTTRGSIIGDELHAPSRRVADTDEPVVLKIKVSGENYDDKLVLLEREDFSAGFDNGWDGDKWDGNESALYLYTKDSEGTENSVSAIPELEGTVIGFRAGEDNNYTMYFDYLNSDEAIYLYDIEANAYTRIETGGIYWFMTNDNEKHDRFIITRKSPQIATGGGNVQSDDVQGTKARKLILDQKIYILVNGMLYDATGKMVK